MPEQQTGFRGTPLADSGRRSPTHHGDDRQRFGGAGRTRDRDRCTGGWDNLVEMAVLLYGQAPRTPTTPAERGGEAERSPMQCPARRSRKTRISMPNSCDNCVNLKAPTLVLWGTADRMIWPSQARYFVEAIANARLVTIEGAPHLLSAVTSEEFLRATLEFRDDSSPTWTEATQQMRL